MRCLVLMGNIGAGKSTIAKMLEAEGWTRIVIDAYRTGHEPDARNRLLNALHVVKGDFVYETTTANWIHAKAMLAIESKKCNVAKVMLIVSEAESLKRVNARGVASPFGKSHAESFGYIDAALRREWADAVFDTEMIEKSVIFDKIKELLL